MKYVPVPGWLSWVGQVFAWLLILGVGAVLAVALVVPRLAGATPYVIETGSMTPTMPPGTLVVVKPVAPDQIAPGDVVTYQIKSGDPTVVTHRVVKQGIDMTGQPRWRTQGDANNAVDASWVLPQQVRGKEWYAVPYLGYVTSFVTSQQRGFIGGLVILVLLGYAGNMFRRALRERRQTRKPASESSQQPAEVTT